MKKIFVSLFLIMLVFFIAACGKKDIDKNIDDNKTVSSISEEKNNSKNKTNDVANDITLPYSYKVPGKNIVIDVPNFQEMEKGFTQLYIMHGVKYVAVTAEKNSSATELATAHVDAFSKFKENIQNYSYVNSLNVTSEKTETINGIEVYKYEGTMNCGKDTIYDAYVIGYSFIMDGVPCTVTGSVIEPSQGQDIIDEIKETVEVMIQTLRSEM